MSTWTGIRAPDTGGRANANTTVFRTVRDGIVQSAIDKTSAIVEIRSGFIRMHQSLAALTDVADGTPAPLSNRPLSMSGSLTD